MSNGTINKGRLSAVAIEGPPNLENGFLKKSPPNKTPNLITVDETKRTNQQTDLTLHAPSQYGNTLNVPNASTIRALPVATPAAPKSIHRPAIMTTPRGPTAVVKNASTAPPTDTKPLLVVTTTNDQQKPQTIVVPNGRRLPVNGNPSQSRQQPAIPTTNNNHQVVNETMPKKVTHNRPRTALLFTSTRMYSQIHYLFYGKFLNLLGNLDRSPEQHRPLLSSETNLNSRNDSVESHSSIDNGINNWSAAPR